MAMISHGCVFNVCIYGGNQRETGNIWDSKSSTLLCVFIHVYLLNNHVYKVVAPFWCFLKFLGTNTNASISGPDTY